MMNLLSGKEVKVLFKQLFLAQAIFEFVLGIFFTYIAIQFVASQGWNFLTILACLLATHSFATCIRMAKTYYALSKL